MSNSAEKLVKQTIKLLSKTQELDYEELKLDAKKLIRAARNFDESLLGIMESIMDLGNVGSEEELEDFDPEVLKIYCRIKELDYSGSDRTLRARVWNHIEEEFELDSDDDEEESEDESVVESEVSEEPEPEPEPVKPKKSRKSKESAEQEVVIIG
jgi:hypothetical protein